MPIRTRQLLDFAKELQTKNTEVADRSACSRAYYAAYLEAERLSSAIPEPEDQDIGLHRRRIRAFTEYDGADLDETAVRAVGVSLRQLHQFRVAADYRINTKFEPDVALQVCTDADYLLSKIDELIKS